MTDHGAPITTEKAQHNFVVDLDPRGDGGWDLWISEQPYRGVDTDAVLRSIGERRRVGGAWSRRWFVCTCRSAFVARYRAEKMIRRAHGLAAQNDAENAKWRENHARAATRVTSADLGTPTAKGASDD